MAADWTAEEHARFDFTLETPTFETPATQNGEPERPYRLYSAADLDLFPPQEWIVADRIPDQGLISLIGPKGTLKTFIALDLACHIALGAPWQGAETTQRNVLYIYAEGPFGARARLDAWCAYYAYVSGEPCDRTHLPLWFLPTRIPINSPKDVAALLIEIHDLPLQPGIIFIDTLNVNLDGEEDGKGMGGFVRGCTMLRSALNAAILAVHHTPISSDERGRGHGAFDAALDTRLIVSRDAERVTLECTHQRNGLDGWNVVFEAVSTAKSLALKPSTASSGTLAGQRRDILQLLHSEEPMSCSTWHRESGLSNSSFYKARNWLSANGFIKVEKRKYSTTDLGRIALAPSTPLPLHRD